MTLYLIFTGAYYYPEGGADDRHEAFEAETDESAIARFREKMPPLADSWRWWHLARVDPDGLAVIARCEDHS